MYYVIKSGNGNYWNTAEGWVIQKKPTRFDQKDQAEYILEYLRDVVDVQSSVRAVRLV